MSESEPTASEALNELRAELDALDFQGLRERAREAETALRRAEAVHAVRVTGLVARGAREAGIAKISRILVLSSGEAAELVDSSERLVSRPRVWGALHEGLIDSQRAAEVVQLLAEVPDPLREALEQQAIAYVLEHPTAELEDELLRMIRDNDPTGRSTD